MSPQSGAAPAPAGAERLPARIKAGYALGDHAINVQLAAVSLFLVFFLTEVAGLPPSLAGLVLLAGRAVDAFTDPLMGRLSDATRWRAGRRRPFFLIGALPFGVSFAALWRPLPFDEPLALFAGYVGLYVANTVFSTILAVPYMALIPELALGYEERTSTHTWRMAAAVLAVLLTAVGTRPLVEALGGGSAGWAGAGAVLGVWVALPWLVVHRVSFERPGFAGRSADGFAAAARALLRRASYRRLTAAFLTARIGVDVASAMMLFYFSYWLGRPGDFPLALGSMLLAVIASLPLWLAAARRFDKRTLFAAGAVFWIGVQAGIACLGPAHPRWVAFALLGLAGIGYAVVDLMPWSMLGDVIDEDELETGERRDGLFSGGFTFVRKLGGASGVAAAGFVLEAAGFAAGRPQSESALLAVRGLTAVLPALSLAAAVAIVRGYPLTRERHAAVLASLGGRRAGALR